MGGFIYRWRRPLIIVLVLMVVSVSLSYTARIRGHVVSLSNIIATIVSPASSSMSFIGHEVGLGVGTVGELFTLQQQNQQLKQKLMSYNSMKLELSQVMAENGRLRGMLNLRNKLGSWRFVAASVVGRNPNSWFDTVVIDRGTGSGVKPGMSVIVPQGVVGRVIATSPTTATVMMLLDPNSGVGAVDARSQSAGVINGGDPIQGTVKFQLFSHRPDVLPGDTVVTSGYSEYYPKGLLIGQVISVAKTRFGLTETATVRPAVNFNRLSTVMVVMAHPSGLTVPPIFGGGAR